MKSYSKITAVIVVFTVSLSFARPIKTKYYKTLDSISKYMAQYSRTLEF